MTADDLAARIVDGASVALAPDYSGCALAVVRALIRRRARGLHLIGVPQLGFQADLLIGAGCVRSLETAAISLGELGQAPRFLAALRAGAIDLQDATCPAIHAGLQAAEKGLPFMPMRGVLGSDLLGHRPDWKVIANPFSPTRAPPEPIVVVPAIRPDVALFHVELADAAGNVWIGVRRELMRMAHAARVTLVTAERVEAGDLLDDDRMAAGTIPALYVTAVAEVAGGAWPMGVGRRPADLEHLAAYAEQARTEEGFARYLERFVTQPAAAE